MSDTLTANQLIAKGSSLTSRNGTYRLMFQTDGNLVIYNRQNQAIWSPNIANKGGIKVILQGDGNFVIYNAQNKALYNTGSQGNPGAKLVMQNDGNVVIYNRANKAVWDSRTAGGHYHPPSSSNVFSSIASTFGDAAKGIASVSKDVVTSPVWKIAAGVVAVIPGIGIPLSAGMVGAAAIGRATSAKDAIMGAAKAGLSAAGAAGFDVASGIALGAKGMTGAGLETVRGMLPAGDARAGFDAALSLHVGRSSGPTAPDNLPPNAKASYYASRGLVKVNAPPVMKKAVISNLTKTPGSDAGVKVAVEEIAPGESWLEWIISHVKKGLHHVVN